MTKKTLVLGASENPVRYSNKAILMLLKYKHQVVAIGNKIGVVDNVDIESGPKQFSEIDTVTIYLGEPRQLQYEDYILGLKPKRIIFNPGAENPRFKTKAEDAGIHCLNACTLVMLSTGQY